MEAKVLGFEHIKDMAKIQTLEKVTKSVEREHMVHSTSLMGSYSETSDCVFPKVH